MLDLAMSFTNRLLKANQIKIKKAARQGPAALSFVASRLLHFNLFTGSLFSLRNIDRQHTIFIGGFDFLFIYIIWKRQTPAEGSESAFYAVIGSAIFFAGGFALTADGQHIILHADINIFLAHTGKFKGQFKSVIGFIHIQTRCERTGCKIKRFLEEFIQSEKRPGVEVRLLESVGKLLLRISITISSILIRNYSLFLKVRSLPI